MEKKILPEALVDAINGRKISHLLFTTYSLEADFFEHYILADLFDVTFSQDPAVRHVQMSLVLREGVEVEVYYDEEVFDSSASLRLDLARIPLRSGGAAFHPKVVLALVEDKESRKSLVAMAGSANLTKGGWWENLECAHVENVGAGAKTGIRDGLIDLLRRLRTLDRSRTTGERPAWEAIHAFVTDLKQESSSLHFYASKASRTFVDFLVDRIGPRHYPWQLEIVSPFFADDPRNSLHLDLAKKLGVSDIRILLPLDEKLQALCSEQYYETIKKAEGVNWASFAGADIEEGKKDKIYRKLHAKIFRLYSKKLREEWIFTGSVNFTAMAFGGKNTEVGFLVKMPEPSYSPMLASLKDVEVVLAPPEKLDKAPRGGEGFPLVLLRYNWAQQTFEVWCESTISLRINDSAGLLVGTASFSGQADWLPVQGTDLDRLENSLRNSSLLTVEVAGHGSRSAMVQETGMSSKPSPLAELTPHQILELWATLDPEKRQRLIVALSMEKLKMLISPEFLEKNGGSEVDSFFSQFSEIFQAFIRLRKHLDDALRTRGRKEFDYYLYGRDFDSLPSFLSSVAESGDFDATLKYVIGLCAKQLLSRYSPGGCSGGGMSKKSFEANSLPAATLSSQIEELLKVKEKIRLQGFNKVPDDFFQWYENTFLEWAEEEMA